MSQDIFFSFSQARPGYFFCSFQRQIIFFYSLQRQVIFFFQNQRQEIVLENNPGPPPRISNGRPLTPCLLLVRPMRRWTDNRLGQTVTGLVSMLCLMCLVQDRDLLSRPDNMDETVQHTLKFQKISHRKTGYAISDELPYLNFILM